MNPLLLVTGLASAPRPSAIGVSLVSIIFKNPRERTMTGLSRVQNWAIFQGEAACDVVNRYPRQDPTKKGSMIRRIRTINPSDMPMSSVASHVTRSLPAMPNAPIS
jgi:hypothetical protein